MISEIIINDQYAKVDAWTCNLQPRWQMMPGTPYQWRQIGRWSVRMCRERKIMGQDVGLWIGSPEVWHRRARHAHQLLSPLQNARHKMEFYDGAESRPCGSELEERRRDMTIRCVCCAYTEKWHHLRRYANESIPSTHRCAWAHYLRRLNGAEHLACLTLSAGIY